MHTRMEPGRARACSQVLWLAWILPRNIATRCTSDSARFVCPNLAESLPDCCASCRNSGAYRIHLDTEARSDRDRIHAQSLCGVLRRGHSGGVPGRWNRTSQTRNSRVDGAIAPTATCIAVSSRASTASCCGQTSGTALTACGQQKVHATCKTGNPSGTVRTRCPRLHRAALHHRCCCRGTLQHHRGGFAPIGDPRLHPRRSTPSSIGIAVDHGRMRLAFRLGMDDLRPCRKQESQCGRATLEAACSSISSAALPQARTSCRTRIVRAAAACQSGFASAHDLRAWPLSILFPCPSLHWSPGPKPRNAR